MAGDASTHLTLKEVEYELREVTAADWFPLGLQLGIKTAKLKEIEKDYPGDVRRCKIEVLDWWHRNTQEVSWLKLANAVEKTGEYDALAQRLRGKMPMRALSPTIDPRGTAPASEPVIENTPLHQPTPPHTGFTQKTSCADTDVGGTVIPPSLQPLSPIDDFPYSYSADTQEELRKRKQHSEEHPKLLRRKRKRYSEEHPKLLRRKRKKYSEEHGQLTSPLKAPLLTASQSPTNQVEGEQSQPLSLEDEIKQFEQKFEDLVDYVLNGFKTGGVSFKRVLKCLRQLPISLKLQCGEFLQSQAARLFRASSIEELFFILSPYWDFLNSSLLAHLAYRFGDDQTIRSVDEYLGQLKEFRMRISINNFIDKWTGTLLPDTQEMIMELGDNWKEKSLEHLEKLRKEVSRKRCFGNYVMPLKEIRMSSVDAVFSLPESVDIHSLELESLWELFQEHQVLRILLNGFCVLNLQLQQPGDFSDGNLPPLEDLQGVSSIIDPYGTAPTSEPAIETTPPQQCTPPHTDAVVPLNTEQEAPMVDIGVTDLRGGSYHFSQQVDSPSLLQSGLLHALPGLEEVKVESDKEGTQYESGEFQTPPQLPQGSGFQHITYKILSYIDDAQSLCRAEQVCTNWNRIIAEGLLWKKLIKKKVKTDPVWRGLSERRGWSQYLFRHTSTEEVTQFYKQLYTNIIRDIDNLQRNWKSGDYKLTRIECYSKKDKEGVYCLQYDDSKIVSGHRDNTIKIWDRKSLSVTTELLGHTDRVRCLQYDDRVIITGSHDSTIRVWDVKDHSLVNRLDHHSDAVMSLKFNSDTLVTGSADDTVAVWDMISPMDIFLRMVLKGHTYTVWAVDFDEKYIVSGSEDMTIKVWQTSTGELVHTLRGHWNVIWCLQYRGKHIVSGSPDSTIRIWDIERGACLRVLEVHNIYFMSIRFDDKRIVSGGFGAIKVWDFQAVLDPRSQADTLGLQTLRHSSSVLSLQFDDFQIVSGSTDDSILIWDFLDPVQPGYMQTDQSKDKKALT